MTLTLPGESFAGLPAGALAGILAEVEAIAQMSLYHGRPVDTPEQLRGWLRDHLGVRIPDVQVCPNHSTPWRAFCDAFFGEHLVVVWEGSRGLAGKTFLMSVLGDAFAILQGADTTILGGSGEQATRVQEYIADWLKREHGGSLVADNRREARLLNHGRLRALMASSRSVRGPHPQKMLCVSGAALVATPDGDVEIRSMVPGHSAYAIDEHGDIIASVVSRVSKKGVKQTVRICFDNGNSLDLTPEHRILTTEGWKHAGQIAAGELCVGLSELWGEATRPASQHDRAVRGLPAGQARRRCPQVRRLRSEVVRAESGAVRDLSAKVHAGIRKALYRLWQGDSAGAICRPSALPGVLEQSACGEGVVLRRLRCQAQAAHDTLQALSSEVYVERAGSGAHECGACDGPAGRVEVQSRDSLPRAARSVGSEVSGASPVRSFHSGLRDRGAEGSGRGQRRVLAQQGQQPGARRTQARSTRSGGLHGAVSQAEPPASLVGRAASVVRVTAVKPGPCIDVWDITIPAHHNFIANGIVVHNCDEVDEMDLPLLNAALGQPMTKNAIREQTVLSSTHQYADGTMTDVLARAETNPRWSHHTWCYRESMAGEDGWLTQTQVDAKRSTVTAQMWDTEYELQEPNPESRAIQPAAVEAMFDEALGVYYGNDGEYIEVEAPVVGGKYVHGADWAKDVDWTIQVTWRYDVYPYRLVAFERMGRRPWPAMVARFDARFERFKGSMGYHDATGIGNVVDGYLAHPAQPVVMVGRPRKDMLSNYISAIERGMFKAPRIKWMYTEHKLASVDAVYGAGHLPDTIAAGALGNLGLPQQYVGGADDWIKHYNDLAAGLATGTAFSAAQVAAMLAQLTGPGADPGKIAALLAQSHNVTQPDGQVISTELQGLRRQGNRARLPNRR